MFIVFGILSILAGCFIFMQSAFMQFLANIAETSYSVIRVYVIIGLALILAGSTSIASHDGTKKWFVYSAVFFYIIAALPGIAYFSTGDISIWTISSSVMVVIYSLWLYFHREKTSTFIDPETTIIDDQK